ncbi:MAG: DUF3828 domain-containing protein [Thermoanaerobaculia bacterium]
MRTPVLPVLLAGFAVALSAAPLAQAAPPATAAPAATDPAGIAKAIYARVSAGKGDGGGQFLWLEAKDRPRTFSKALVALWAKADAKADREQDMGPIDWDPFTASQDPMVKSFTVVVERQDANAATVAVTLVDPRGRRKVAADETVRLDFVREGARWAIDDVRGSVDGHSWSVKEILKSYLSP